MQLRDFLIAVAEGYDYRDGFDTSQQRLLRRAPEVLRDYGPAEFLLKPSGGQQNLGATITPWFGFFDPDELTTPMDGLYVVWLLDADGKNWTLSLMLGTEKRAKAIAEAGGDHKERRILESLRTEANAIREALPEHMVQAWDKTIDLRSRGQRQRRYEAATILAQTYSMESLPRDSSLNADLLALCIVLQEAAKIKRGLALAKAGIASPGDSEVPDLNVWDPVFDPGTDRVSTVRLKKRKIIRTPRHEGGLERYGRWLEGRGFRPATNVYPCDFVVPGTQEWLGEYKVVYGTDVRRATREALSQLKEYRHFLYPQKGLGLLAVFSDAITDERVAWLNEEGIAVVWDHEHEWRGCGRARAAGLGL